jgi:hypothetical protein
VKHFALSLPFNHVPIPLINISVKTNTLFQLTRIMAFTTMLDFVDIPIFGHPKHPRNTID